MARVEGWTGLLIAVAVAIVGLTVFAVGAMRSLDEVAGLVGATHVHVPDASAAAVYARLAPIFSALPRQLEEQYRAIAVFQRDEA